MEIILHLKLIRTHHGYPSTLFHLQLHEVQLGLVARRGNLRRYEPSPGDIIGLYIPHSKMEGTLGLRRSKGMHSLHRHMSYQTSTLLHLC